MSNAGSSQDSFGAKGTLDVDGKSYEIYRLTRSTGRVSTSSRCPYSLKVLLENLLRTEDGANITADDIKALAGWDADADPEQGDPVHPGARDHAGLHRRPLRRRPGHHARGDGRARRRRRPRSTRSRPPRWSSTTP